MSSIFGTKRVLVEEPEETDGRPTLSKEEEKEFRELFRLVDKDGNGTISKEEMIELLKTMSIRPTEAETGMIFHELDGNRDGQIGDDEFVAFMSTGVIRSTTSEQVLKAFKVLELEGFAPSGRMYKDDFSRAMLTYLPDKVKKPADAQALLAHIKVEPTGKLAGTFDYERYVANNTPLPEAEAKRVREEMRRQASIERKVEEARERERKELEGPAPAGAAGGETAAWGESDEDDMDGVLEDDETVVGDARDISTPQQFNHNIPRGMRGASSTAASTQRSPRPPAPGAAPLTVGQAGQPSQRSARGAASSVAPAAKRAPPAAAGRR